MNLSRGDEDQPAITVDQFDLPEEDSVYINPRRIPAKEKLPRSGDKRPSTGPKDTQEEPSRKRQRLTRTCASTSKDELQPSAREPLDDTYCRSASLGPNPTVSKHADGSKELRRPKAVRAKVSSVKLAYESVDQAIREQRLYHSVVQTPVQLEEVEAGEDSDEEECLQYEREWRLAIANDEVNDFTDTLPVEKLFFNLWNQFLTMEFHTYADKTLPPACMQFVKSTVECIMALARNNGS